MLRRALRFCRHLLLALLLLTALAGAVAWLWRLPLAEWTAARVAAANGVALRIDIAELALDHLSAGAIRLGDDPPVTASGARVDYRIAALLDGILDRIRVDGLRAHAVLDDDGLRIPALERLGGGGGGGGLPALPPIHLNDARLTLDTPQGTAAVGGTLDVQLDNDALAVTGDITATLGDNRLAGRIDASRDADGRIAGRLDLTGGALARDGIAATLAQSHLIGSWDPSRDALPTLDGHLALPGLRLRDIALGMTTLDLASDGIAARASLATVSENGAQRLTADLVLFDALSQPTVTLLAVLDLDSLAPFSDLLARGRVTVDAVAAPATLAALPDLATLPVAATMRLDLADLALPDRLRQGEVRATLRLATTEAGALTVQLDEPAHLAGAVPEPLRVTLQPTDEPLATIRLADRHAAGRVDAMLTLPQGDVALAADYMAQADGGGWRVDLPRMTASAAALSLPPAKLSETAVQARDVTLRLGSTVAATAAAVTAAVSRWSAADFAGDAALDATDVAWSPEGVTATGKLALGATGAGLDGARLQADITASGTPEQFNVILGECATLTLRRFAAGAATATGGPLRLCPAEAPALRRGATTEVALRLRPSTWRLEAGTPLDVQLATFDVTASLGTDGWTAQLAGRNSGLEAPDLQIGAEEINLDLALTGTRDAKAKLGIGWLRDRRPAPRFMPFKLAGTATLAGDKVNADGILQDRGEQARVRLAATHDLKSGRGSAEAVTDPPIAFAPDGAQPQRLVPLLRGKLTSVDGIVAGEARASWGDGPLAGTATIEITSLGAQTPVAVLAGLDGKLSFASLLPPATAPRQKLTLASLDVGLPLQNGVAELTLRPDGKLAIHALGWPWAGGRIHLEDEVVDPTAETITLTLRVDDVDLAELVKLVENEELQATGRVDGTIPVEIVGDTVFIRQARLTSTGGGTLRYGSEAGAAVLETGGEGSELLANALKDFRYDSLVLTLDGKTAGELDLAMQIRGFSPEVYSGSPVELNLSVGGALLEMLQQGLAGYRIPDNIVRQLRGETDDAPQDVARPGDNPGPGRELRSDGQAGGP
jgi:hypothetical protein